MYVTHEERWLDLSLRNLTGAWLRRVEERFAIVYEAPLGAHSDNATSAFHVGTFPLRIIDSSRGNNKVLDGG